MRYDLFRFDLGRDPHAPALAELSVFTILIVAACAALVAASTLVALTHGWDYRLALMLGAVLAVALARFGWRTLPAERVADRLALAFAGTLAAALFCTYASDWLDWQPLDLDDAVAGMTVGLLLLLAGPVRRVLHHAAEVPTAAGLTVVALALAPAEWAAFVHWFQGAALGAAERYALIDAPGFAAALAVTGLGFWFALRRRLYAAAMALSPVAWFLLLVLGIDGDASLVVGVLVGAIVGAGLMITSVNAWVRSARNAPDRLSRIPASVLIVGAKALLAGPVRRALRLEVRASNVATLAAFVMLALVAAACFWLAYERRWQEAAALHDLLKHLEPKIMLAIAALAFVVALRFRLERTALVASAAMGVGLLLLGIPYKSGTDIGTVTFLAGTVAGILVFAARAARRASASGAPARPAELLLLLAAATAVIFVTGLQPLEYFLAAATVGIWWWFYYRRGVPLVAPGVVERIGRRQPLLRLALGASLGVTVGAHLLLLQAALCNQTGAMIFAELGKFHLYPVSDATLARAMLADQYLWRDSVPVAEARSAWWVLEKSRHPRDRWSRTYYVSGRASDEKREVTGLGLETREVAGGSLVSYVEGGSPAQQAGVRRGDVIRAIDGIPVDRPEPRQWWEIKPTMRLELVSAVGEVREVSVTPAEYRRSAVSVERVVEAAGRRIGYVELRNFRGNADDDFIEAAERLRRRSIDELVLDLRMNPGGYVEASLHVASAIGGKRLDGKVFERIVHNERYRERDQDLRFSVPARGALSLSRVFVITSRRSCSASEGLINGLSPHMEVVRIGGTTCGKPVGSYFIEYGDTGFSVITFRGVNARGEGDFYDGLRPTCAADNDVRRDFGDPEEASFKAALYYIQHGRCPEPAVWL